MIGNVVDLGNYMNLWAMEILIKHWDGNSMGMNNTYIYNNATTPDPVPIPGNISQIKLFFIMSGTDQILQTNRNWSLNDYKNSFLARKMAADPACFNMLKNTIRSLLDNVFSPDIYYNVTLPFVKHCRATLQSMGVGVSVNTVIDQLKLVYPSGYGLLGLTPPKNINNSPIWVEDEGLPGGAEWNTTHETSEQITWVTNPLFSGTKAHQSTYRLGLHQHFFNGGFTPSLPIAKGDELYTYVYLDPTYTPTEVMLQWFNGDWRRAFWGNDIISWSPKVNKGALPTAGIWVKLSIPASELGLENTSLSGMAFTLNDGKATWDAAGVKKMNAWVEDDVLPTGAQWNTTDETSEQFTWVISPVYSGTKAHQSAFGSGLHQHFFNYATAHMKVCRGSELYTYIYLDPTSTPEEIMIQWFNGDWHRAYWGSSNNIIGWSGAYMGPIPPAGKWVKLTVPASYIGIEGSEVTGMAFTLYGGKATWDASGVENEATVLNW